ncbi:MAG: copper amine oxidase N-terminal domain-containing protein [Vulcanimicrobiaceae bacterium]
MVRNNVFLMSCGVLASLASLQLCAVPALAADVSVTVNGQYVSIAPPPLERAGRVFVPLRGIFEKLGASVVYSGGIINATGSGRTISLKIGSTQAMVNGQPQPLDVAPFIVGASTYVPLRFVSEALGAGVNYDGTNRVVALNTNGNNAPPPNAPPPQQPMQNGRALSNVLPARDAAVGAERPTISADFTQPVDPNSVRLSLDGLDVTSGATRSSSGFIYAPQSPLQSMKHRVDVTGTFRSGEPFSQSWSFASGSAPQQNSLAISAPQNNAPVGSNFVVSGRTAPNARVHIVAGASASVGGLFAFGTGSYTGDTVADASGRFSQQVQLQSVRGSQIAVTITSTDPSTGESAQRKLSLSLQ